MVKVYVFWYCLFHDDGAICIHDENEDLEIPDWFNICEVSILDRNVICNYTCKGIIECNDDNNIIVIHEPQWTFEREGGGFKFCYYLNNVYEGNSEKKDLEATDKHYIFLEWFNLKVHEIENRQNGNID
jgi:hypothetical protein